MKRLFLSVASAAIAVGLAQTAYGLVAAQTMPSSLPMPTATPAVKATATPAPPKDADDKRVGISGVWEVQIQQPASTVYTHFKLDQKGSALTGQYLDAKGKRYPLTGTVDGKDVHLVVSMSDGSALVFSANVESAMDMAGTIDSAKDTVGFTAAYRPKYKWIDNLSPNPGIGGTP